MAYMAYMAYMAQMACRARWEEFFHACAGEAWESQGTIRPEPQCSCVLGRGLGGENMGRSRISIATMITIALKEPLDVALAKLWLFW